MKNYYANRPFQTKFMLCIFFIPYVKIELYLDNAEKNQRVKLRFNAE